MRSITLIYSVAALALSLATPLTNAADGSPYTAPLPSDKTFTVNISDPSTTNLADGTAAVNFYINVSGIDLTQFGLQNSYSLPSVLTDADKNNDLCEVFIGKIFDATGILPAVKFPTGMTHFLTQQEFYDKYNLQLATTADTGTAPGTPAPSGPGGGSPPPMGCC